MSRTIAIGDIHGHLSALDALLAAVRPRRDDLIITLGDVIDRGPDSVGVIERLLQLHRTVRIVSLVGNHEEMMMAARDSSSALGMWVLCGGKATLDSYHRAYATRRYNASDMCETLDRPLNRIPDRHWEFLEYSCVNFFETRTHIFVHANVDAERDLRRTPLETIRWKKFFPPPPAHCSGKTVVCGHTVQRLTHRPAAWPAAVCIDTGVHEDDGFLTALDVTGGFYWQANKSGRVRTAQLQPQPTG
jgi:serine/threonine protein phosphatase 1